MLAIFIVLNVKPTAKVISEPKAGRVSIFVSVVVLTSMQGEGA